jgi:hypothetical protein
MMTLDWWICVDLDKCCYKLIKASLITDAQIAAGPEYLMVGPYLEKDLMTELQAFMRSQPREIKENMILVE